MIPAEFQYYNPKTVAEAAALLNQFGDDAKVIAGGHSLLPAMKLRLAAPGVLVDVSGIGELKGITDTGDALEIGAGTTYHALASSAAVRGACVVLAECASQIGDIQVRNRGTIGGALAHADPAADLTAVVLALGATLTVQSATALGEVAKDLKGEGLMDSIRSVIARVSSGVTTRTVAADDFFVEMLTTALEPGEIVTKITVPKLGRGEGAAYAKLRHPASRYAIVGVAAYVKLGVNAQVEVARVAVTGAGPKAVRQPDTEGALVGSDGGEAAIAAAAAQAGEAMDYLGDIHASEEYRRAMVKVYTRRALSEAMARARA
jgi:carbon-monoxide dehydrogenase medium subunit